MSTIKSLEYLSYDTSKAKKPSVRKIIENGLAHNMLKAKTQGDIELIEEYSKNIIDVSGDEEKEQIIKNYLIKNKMCVDRMYNCEKALNVDPVTKIKVHCHNCETDFFAGEFIWTNDREHPNCKNFPICPNPWSVFDIWWGVHVKDWVPVSEEKNIIS